MSKTMYGVLRSKRQFPCC